VTPSPSHRGDERIAAGMTALRAGDTDAALAAFESAEAEARATDDAVLLSTALRHQSLVLRQRSEWDRAIGLARAAADAARAAGLREELAQALNAEGIVHESRGALDEAAVPLREAASLTSDSRVLAIVLANLGSLAAQQGDLATARRYFLDAAARFRDAGYAFGEAAVLNNFGRAALDRGNARVALPMLDDALGAARRAGDSELTALVRRNRAEALVLLGQHHEGESEAAGALAVFSGAANHVRCAECLRVLADAACARRDVDGARARLREALAAADAGGAVLERERIAERLAAMDAAAAE
jgi:tetratricopeptide (TPR) repeat protein